MSTPKGTSPIINRTVTSVIAEHLRDRILGGEFRGGESLLQDALAADYNVSRIPLREALRQLEAEGLLTSMPHRGVTVSISTEEESRDNFLIRALLECDLLRCSIPNLEEKYIDEAEELMTNYRDRLDPNAMASSCGALNWQFHSLLYEGVNRPKSISILHSLHHGIDSFAHNEQVVKQGLDQVIEEHFGLIKLCRERNVEGAVSLLRHHITSRLKWAKGDPDLQKQDVTAKTNNTQ